MIKKLTIKQEKHVVQNFFSDEIYTIMQKGTNYILRCLKKNKKKLLNRMLEKKLLKVEGRSLNMYTYTIKGDNVCCFQASMHL